MSVWIMLRPTDVWLFRDARPFTAGASYVARSVFPPFPETIQGALRTARLEAEGVDWRAYAEGAIPETLAALVGLPGRSARGGVPARDMRVGSYRLRGPWIARLNGKTFTRYFPVPLDVLQAGEADSKQFVLPISQEPAFTTSVPTGWDETRHHWYALSPPEGFQRVKAVEDDSWLDEEGFTSYLQGKASFKFTHSDKLFVTEERPGLGLDSTRRAARQSLYYLARFIRPRPGIGLAEEVSDGFLPSENGVVMLGGEGRTATYTQIDPPPDLPHATDGQVKVVLLTPAWFTGGWHPAHSGWSPWMGTTAKLVSIALGKPVPISGWDIVNNQPKPLYEFIPAGSVFYFKDAVVQGLAFTEMPPDRPDLIAAGYGAYATATWK